MHDPSAKGQRRANCTKSLGTGKNWIVKPESEWITTPCPSIISTDLWNQVNDVLIIQEKKSKRTGKRAVYLLTGLVTCDCGKTMYVDAVLKELSLQGV